MYRFARLVGAAAAACAAFAPVAANAATSAPAPSPTSYVATTLLGPGVVQSAAYTGPVAPLANAVAADGKGGFYYTESLNHRIRHMSVSGEDTVVAGTGETRKTQPGCQAWDVPALEACLWVPHGVTVDTDGGIIIADTFNEVITKVGKDGVLRRLAGTGKRCRDGDKCGVGGPALNAQLKMPTIARRTGQGLVISDSGNRILLVRDGRMYKIAGTGMPGFSGDNGPATKAKLWAPADVIPYFGGWLISDGNNCRLRWVDRKGIIHPFAGYGGNLHVCWKSYATSNGRWGGPLTGNVGDGGSAYRSRMSVTGFFAQAGADVYVTDFLNNRVRKISDGKITTVVGTGGPYGTNTNGPVVANTYRLGLPSGLAYDPSRARLLLTDPGTARIIQVKLPVKYR